MNDFAGALGVAVGRTRPPVLVTRGLPQEALDRIEARCDMTLYGGEGAMARDQLLTGGGREGGGYRC